MPHIRIGRGALVSSADRIGAFSAYLIIAVMTAMIVADAILHIVGIQFVG